LDIDTSRTIGWYTILYPVLLSTNTTCSSLYAVLQHVQGILANIPQNGFDYLLMQAHEQLPKSERPQVKFNYLGRFQQHKETLFALQPKTNIAQLD
ncbi:hypothetical protein ABTK82_19195, partial [Acinetobacter baumannii]